MATVRMLAAQNFWAPHDHIGGRHSPDMQWLQILEHQAQPPARPP